MRVKHKESGKEYEVYKIEKEKSGTYILVWKDIIENIIDISTNQVKEQREIYRWVWNDIDNYEPISEEQIYYLPPDKEYDEKLKDSIKKELRKIERFKLFGGETE